MPTSARSLGCTAAMLSRSGTAARMGETYKVKPLTRIHRVPDEVCGPIDKEGVDADHRAAVVHYLLDMG